MGTFPQSPNPPRWSPSSTCSSPPPLSPIPISPGKGGAAPKPVPKATPACTNSPGLGGCSESHPGLKHVQNWKGPGRSSAKVPPSPVAAAQRIGQRLPSPCFSLAFPKSTSLVGVSNGVGTWDGLEPAGWSEPEFLGAWSIVMGRGQGRRGGPCSWGRGQGRGAHWARAWSMALEAWSMATGRGYR